jgi:hypothetical protein
METLCRHRVIEECIYVANEEKQSRCRQAAGVSKVSKLSLGSDSGFKIYSIYPQ